jgi:hypothetical protein
MGNGSIPTEPIPLTCSTLPARKTSWDVPSASVGSSPVTFALWAAATSYCPPIWRRTEESAEGFDNTCLEINDTQRHATDATEHNEMQRKASKTVRRE